MKFFSLVRFFEQRLRRKPRSTAQADGRGKGRLGLEALEARHLLSNVPTIIAAGVLPPDGSGIELNVAAPSSAHPPIQIEFSEAMAGNNVTRTGAANPANYFIFDSHGKPISVDSATLDGTQTFVTLAYNGGAPLPLDTYTVFVRGNQLFDLVHSLPITDTQQLVAANFGAGNISVISVPGDGTLGAMSNYPTPISPTSFSGAQPIGVALQDLTGDGDLDLVVADAQGRQIDIYKGRPKSGNSGYNLTPDFILNLPSGATPAALVVTPLFGFGGLPDIAVASSRANNVTVFTNNANQPGVLNFSGGTSFAEGGLNPDNMVAADVDGDGRPDLIVANATRDASNNYSFSILRNTGNGQFAAAVVTTVGTFGNPSTGVLVPKAITAAFTSSNFLPDILVSGSSGGTLRFTNQSRPGTIALTNTTLSAITFSALAAGKVQAGGGFLDDVVGTNFGKVYVFANDGAGNLAAPLSFNDGIFNESALALQNVSGGGKKDIVVIGGNFGGGQVSVLKNLSTAVINFAAPKVARTGSNPVALAIGDTNADGMVDVATANAGSADVTILQGNGDGTFVQTTDTPGLNNPIAITSGDLTGDGNLDLVVVENDSANGPRVAVYKGMGGGAYAPPVFFNPALPGHNVRDLVSVTIGKITGGAKPDIIVADREDGVIGILKNKSVSGTIDSTSFAPIQEVFVGEQPTQVVLGDLDNDGKLDLVVAHDRKTGLPSVTQKGVSILLGNGNGTFQGDNEFATDVDASAVAVGDFLKNGVLAFVVADDAAPGHVQLWEGDGAGKFHIRGIYTTGIINPGSITVGDFNNDGYPDLAVASKSNGVTTGGIAVLLNQDATGFGQAIMTSLGINSAQQTIALKSIVATHLDADANLDLVVTTLPGANQTNDVNILTFLGNGDGTFQPPTPYLAGGFSSNPTDVTALNDPLVRVTTFHIAIGVSVINLVRNPGFEAADLTGATGNLLGWQTYDLPDQFGGSHGRWSSQTGGVSPLSGSLVPIPPQGNYQAMLDEANLNPISVNGFNPNAINTYSGTHALYQDIFIPFNANTAGAVTLSLTLYLQSDAPFTNTNLTPALDYRTENTRVANQQVRVDIMDPAGDLLGIDGAHGVLRAEFVTKPSDPTNSSVLFTITDNDLSAFAGKTIRLRIAETNNQGKLIVGVDQVKLIASFVDGVPPILSSVRLQNPGFVGDPNGNTPHTTDTTINGNVNDNGSVNNIAYVEFDPNNDGFNQTDDFKVLTVDPAGNFTFTVPGLVPGLHTIGVRTIDRVGLASPVSTITFFLQGPSFTEFKAVGPGPIDTTNQGVDYVNVTGRTTAVVVDPSDRSGNHLYIGTPNGGIWETTNGGNTWIPRLDYLNDSSGQPVRAPIGALAIAKTNPLILYAGTGVADLNPDSRYGVGVLKSTDGGKTWTIIGNSGTVVGSARISKIVIDNNDPNTVYAGVAAGGANGPGVYRSTDGGLTWVDVLDPATMRLAGTANPPKFLGAGTPLASVTDLVIDPFNSNRLLVALGNIGLANGGPTAGVWRTINKGNSWDQIVGGDLYPNSNLPFGAGVGRITLAIGSGRVGDEANVYVLMGTPPGNNTPPNVDYGRELGLYKTSDNLSNFTKIMLRQNTTPFGDGDPEDGTEIPGLDHNFKDINLLGNDASNVGALAVDPTNPNVVYVGGSRRYAPEGPEAFVPLRLRLSHAFIRVDTGNMNDGHQTDILAFENTGDDLTKDLAGDRSGDLYPPADADDPYIGEGVSWYDLEQESSTFPGLKRDLPPSINNLSFDGQGRLVIGTDGGVFRGVSRGFTYDYSSGGFGILSAATPGITPGLKISSINGNLQITALTSVGVDPAKHNQYYTTQLGAGTAGVASAGLAGFSSEGLTGPGGTGLDVQNAGTVRVVAPVPGAAAGTPSTVFRVWQYARISVDSFGQNIGLRPDFSLDGGLTFNPITSPGISVQDRGAMFPALAVDPNKVFDSGVFQNELLFGTDKVYLTRTTNNAFDPLSSTISPTGGLVTAVAFALSKPGFYYAGTNKGEIFVTTNTGADGFPERDNGLPKAQVNEIVVDPNNALHAFAVFGGLSIPHVWATNDGGMTWTNISGNLANVETHTIAFDPGVTAAAPNGTIYVGNDSGVFATVDGGKNWKSPAAGLPHSPVLDLQFDPKQGVLAAALQGRGIFTFSTDHSGPSIVSLTAPVGSTLNTVFVTFSKSIDPSSLTLSQIKILDPLGNSVTPTGVTLFDPNGDQVKYQISFAPQTTPGLYRVFVGPDVADFNGTKIDQNQNQIPGENPGDIFVGRAFFQPGANAAPVLPANETVLLNNLFEDNLNDAGTDVPTILVRANITDANPGAIKGIAVTNTDSFFGKWQYSRDGGASWTDFGTPSELNARLLENASYNRVRFVPLQFFVGDQTFKFRAWDLSSGLTQPNNTDGGTADTTANGNTTAFSANEATGKLTVLYFNQVPTFTKGPDESVLENSGPASFPNWATNINPGQPIESNQTVTFIVQSDTPSLFAVQPAIASNGTLTFTPGAFQSGTTTVYVRALDNGGTANGGQDTGVLQTFKITILLVNQTPSFTVGPNVTVKVFSGTTTVPRFVTNISAGVGNEQNQGLTFIVTTDRPDLFTVQPSIAPDGTLTFGPANKNIGTATVTVRLMDDAGTANGGVNISAPQTFTITIAAVVASGSANQTWVSQAFRDLLHREIDPNSLAFFTNQLENGLHRFDAALEITNSQEFRTNYVTGLFNKSLGTPPDAKGLSFYIGLINNGDTLVDVRARVLASDAFYFKQNKPSPFSFLNGVYQDVFGHGIDPAGVQKWGTLLAKNGSRFLTALAILTTTDAYTVEVNADFTALLGHVADADGVTYYVSNLLNGFREEGVLGSIVASVEYSNKLIPVYDSTLDRKWLNQVFTDLLNRGADLNALNFFTTELRQGKTRQDVVTQIATSDEYRFLYVSNVFNHALNRQPSAAESSNFVTSVKQGATLEQVQSLLYGSAEYFQTRGKGNNFDFLTALFADVLGAPLDDNSRSLYGSRLAAGASNQSVALSVLTSSSASNVLVGVYYRVYLRRDPDSGLASFVAALQSGTRDEVVLGDFLGSTEYYGKFTK